jgi:GT2 family glycosyltransferase
VEYGNFEVIVVDNGSTDDSGMRLRREFPDGKFLRCEQNLGFTGGNNLGMKEALEDGADYVLLLNNDTLVDPSFLKHLVRVAESDSRIGIVGPKIFYASEPQRIWYAGGSITYAGCVHFGKDQIDQNDKFSRIEDTGFITGCAMMVKAKVLREIGLLDDKLFVYHEDSEFCMRARAAGYRFVFVPTAHIWHKISQTCGLESPFTLYLSTRNQLNLVAKHVPFPYKPLALAFTVGKKIARMAIFSLKRPDAAKAVGAGIWDFLHGTYGPPLKNRLPKRQSPAPTELSN